MSDELINMMHQPAIERVRDGGTGGDGMLGMFQACIADAEVEERDTAQILVTYVDEDDEFVPGTYVPELWLVVRKVPDAEN